MARSRSHERRASRALPSMLAVRLPRRGDDPRAREAIPPNRWVCAPNMDRNNPRSGIVCLSDMYGYRACPECGAAVQRARLEAHTHDCDPERVISHQTLKARRGLDRLEDDLAFW